MNTHRVRLTLQVLALLPMIGFLLIYIGDVFAVVGAFLLLMFIAVSLYRYSQKHPPFNTPLVVLLMGSFYLYAFYGLGSTQTPQTFHTLKNGQGVTLFDFDTSVKIDEVCYYVGIDKNVNFTLESQSAKGWKKFYTYENSYPYSFRWKCISTKLHTSKILLRITKNQMMLNEIRFRYQGEVLAYTNSKKYLNDEPTCEIDTGYYTGMFFDEIYFGRTAYEIMYDINVYENTHPYLGKYLIIPGIKLFGMTPFGWRFMNVLFAGILIFMAYYFGLHLFKREEYAFTSAFLMTYSFMHLAQARVGLIDTFGVLFVFISYFYLYRFIVGQQLSRLLVSGVFFGLSASVKWSAVFASLGFVFIALYLLWIRYPLAKRFAGYRLLLYGGLSYGIVALLVYTLSFWEIGSMEYIINYNTNMYHYHSTLQATHPYSSAWWSWLLDMKPMGYYKALKEGMLSSINSFGNPAIFWMGIVSLFYLIGVVVIRKSMEAGFILFAFLGLYLPYISVERLMFIYHIYYALPFLLLGIVYMFRDMIERFSLMRLALWGYLLIVMCLFLAFYPVLSGYEIDNAYVSLWLKWFGTWWF